ncbi:MAG: TerB family tellurite resistance protein [Candidatus Sericytochromatia bacterium]
MSQYNAQAVEQRYGKQPKSYEQALNYLKALKCVIAADGEIAESEWQALLKGMKRVGASADAVQAITEFDPASTTLEALLPDFTKGGKRARMLIRDAIEISRADGHYAQAEKDAVQKMAQILAVDASVVKSIEALVEMEHAVKRLRKALL